MYVLLLSGFVGDFLATLALFAICVILVFGAKFSILVIKEYLPKKEIYIPQENKKPLPPRKKRAKVYSSSIKPIRSIEIDPTKIDRIYVKKSS